MDGSMFEKLQCVPPLPLVPVVWRAGWSDGAMGSSQATTLSNLRRELMAIYIGQTRRLREGMVDRGPELQRAATLYLQEVRNLCIQSGDRAGKQRSFPLVIEWMFVELDPEQSKPMCMVETMPAMEYLVIAGGVCVLQHAKARQLQLQDEFSAAIEMYRLCTQQVGAYSAQFFGSVVSRRQWAKIRRSNLALQMMPMWWGLLADLSRHNAQICAVLREDPGGHTDRYSRGCYDTLSKVVSGTRRMLTEQKFLNQLQREVLQTSYDANIETLRLWMAERLRCEASIAIKTYETDIAYALLKQCEELIQAIPEDVALRKTVVEMQQQMERFSTGAYAIVDKAHCERWKQTLESVIFAIPPF